jgi:recombination protein RecA
MARKRNAEVPEEVESTAEALLDDNASDAMLARLLEQTGVDTLENSNEGYNEENVLPTGIATLDVATGIGGFPKGRMIEIYGDESAGKTTNFLHVAGSAQRHGMPVVFIDAENTLSLDYSAELGVDVTKMLVNRPESLEDAMDLMLRTMKAEVAAGSTKGVLFIFDSVPAIKSMEVMEKGAGERSMMAEANRWAENGPKLITLAARTNSIILLVNQTRADTTATNARYAKKMTPGGKFIKFAASQRLEISAKPRIEGKDNVRVGQDTTVKFVKNKTSPGQGRKAQYFLPAGKPVQWAEDVIEAAILSDLVLVDTKYDEKTDTLEPSKNAFTLVLNESLIDLIREDEFDIHLDNGLFEAEQRGEVDDNGEFVNRNDADNFESEFTDDQKYYSVRFRQKFIDSLSDFPRLLDRLEREIRAKVREKKPVAATRKVRPDATVLNTKRLLTVAERRELAAKNITADSDAAPAGEVAEAEKPKRGRPAKPKTEEELDAPKRPRGRPRKEDSEAPADDDSEANEPSEDATDAA